MLPPSHPAHRAGVRNDRIRLSQKVSRCRPREAVRRRGQTLCVLEFLAQVIREGRCSQTCDTATDCWVDILPEADRYLGRMSTQKDKEKLELLQGTPDLLILRTLIFGPQHGQWIARAIQDKQLGKETAKWNRLAKAIGRILESEPARG